VNGKELSLLIKGGTIVFGGVRNQADVLVQGDRIVNVEPGIRADGSEIINAEGKYVLPGAIDVHTHMQLPVSGTVSSDDFFTGTRAAAFGGVTTIIDFATQSKGESLKETAARRRSEAEDKVCIDYSLHLGVTDLTDEILAEIPVMIDRGYPSFKLFMAYPELAVDDGELYAVLKTVSEAGGMVGVHAENMHLIRHFVRTLLTEGKAAAMYHEMSRPAFVEAEAVGRAIVLAAETKSNLYFFHLSTARGLTEIRKARKKGLPVYAETCPQYLLLNRNKYKEPDSIAARYVMSPPLRGEEDQSALWSGLADGSLQVVGSDHCPFRTEQKELGKASFDRIPNGGPGVETLLPLLLSEGVGKGRLALERLVEIVSTEPARLFGLYPRKGAVLAGSDADLVIIDPAKEFALSAETLHMNIDYSLYEGLVLKGYPVITVSKGKVICSEGRFFGAPGEGKFIARQKMPQR
jgi:dihydropyrimidinase